MEKDFLKQIHDDILSKGFITISFLMVLIIFLIIDIEKIQLLLNIITFTLSFIGSIVLTMINIKYKAYRTEKQNKIIFNNTLLFIALTVTAAFKIIKQIY
ncbi:hypothetical protein [Anaerophilus nitritogenes]|uniref:hypothetical protein n=1 Tax=Anaerophilus nitritogenes TaxID=2498136 RepID=UPI00101C2DDD|nr:hypothetical protein [Anaerophilus nitritogenes]